MEAYDAAVITYALASAKTKQGLFGLPPMGKINDSDSLTPPCPQDGGKIDSRAQLYQLLCRIEQHLINKSDIELQHLLDICAAKPNQGDQQILANLECLQTELRHICRTNSGNVHTTIFIFDENGLSGQALKSEMICKTIMDLLKQFGLNIGCNILRKSCKFS